MKLFQYIPDLYYTHPLVLAELSFVNYISWNKSRKESKHLPKVKPSKVKMSRGSAKRAMFQYHYAMFQHNYTILEYIWFKG